MRIGITGATGLIGTAVGQLAAAHGHQVVAYSRSAVARHPSWVTEGRVLDVAAALPLDASGLDVLIHLAGETVLGFWTQAKRQRIRESRVDLTQRLARCLAQAVPRPTALISGSGIGFYGSRGDDLLDETATRGHDFLADICVDWEAAAQSVEQLGIRVVLLRTGLVLAQEGGAYPLMRRAFRSGLGGRLGDGSQWMPWIHLHDEARLILWAAEHRSLSGPMNLVAPEPATNAQFTTALAASLHRPAFLPVPAFALRAVLGDLGSMIMASQRATPSLALSQGFQFDHPSLAKALAALAG